MRVLFVDDEPQILRGITRMLESEEDDWDVETAESGHEALDLLEEESVDVIVSDMKMPGMDGAALLDEVSRLYPATVRIILSGQANKESVYRAISPMHQYLSKPCDSDELRETITRACALREIIQQAKSNQLLCGITSLPSLPGIYQNLVSEIRSDECSLAKIGKLISQDPAMTAKILQLVNSAIFGVRSTVNSPIQAASLIGTDTLKSLVLSMSVFRALEGTQPPGFSIDQISTHCVQVGNLCHQIALIENFSEEAVNEAFTSGLLHDVGKLMIASYAPEDFELSVEMSKRESIPLVEAERKIIGLGHDGIGAYLLALWGLPQSIVESVCFHHSPDQCLSNGLTSAAVVYLANGIVSGATDEDSDGHQVFNQFVAEMNLKDRVPLWCNTAKEVQG